MFGFYKNSVKTKSSNFYSTLLYKNNTYLSFQFIYIKLLINYLKNREKEEINITDITWLLMAIKCSYNYFSIFNKY